MPRALLHADLDAFYASVEQLDNPELRGRPVVVGGPPEARGVVAAASYEARAFGVRSAQPMRTALMRCPDAIRVSARFDRYHAVSEQVFSIYRAWTPVIEPLSMDEAYLDITAVLPAVTTGALEEAAARLKAEVRAASGLTLSVGAGSTKSVVKIASDLRKPDGLVVVPPGEERAFLAPLPIGRLWGVGPKGEERLQRLGVRTIGDLAALDHAWVVDRFGRWGEMLHDLAQGNDAREVTPDRETKSVSRETTFAEDVSDVARLNKVLRSLAGDVAGGLRRHSLRGRTITLKARDATFQTWSRQVTLPVPTDDAATIGETACQLLAQEMRPGRRLRLIGVGVSGFNESLQLALPL